MPLNKETETFTKTDFIEDNSPKTLSDKNQQASYQKFRQLKTDLFEL